MNDRVIGLGFSYDCEIGFHDCESGILQRLEVDFEAETDWSEAARRDRPEGLVDYYQINLAIAELLSGRRWNLIESVAQSIAEMICRDHPVERVRVRVTKRPLDMHNARAVAVECVRSAEDL